MNRLTVAVAAAMLALPASAIAAATRGVVLSVDAGHHTIQVVNGKHRVDAYRYRGRLPRLHTGSRISFARTGHTIASVRVAPGKPRSVTFFARVVRSNSDGIVLRLSDGKTVSFASTQISGVLQRVRVKTQWIRWRSVRAGAVQAGSKSPTLSVAPGTLVLVTETTSGGHSTIAVTLPSGAPSPHGGSQQPGSQQPGNQQPGNQQPTGTTSGDVIGTITQLSPTRLTVSAGGRSMSFTCDPADDLTDGFVVGDLVDVTYDAGSGSAVASDVEYVEADATGTVTAVDTSSLTLTDSDTGQTETIVADPAEDMFDGVSVNDEVVITYHRSAGQLIADV